MWSNAMLLSDVDENLEEPVVRTVKQCSRTRATFIVVFVFTCIVMASAIIAFLMPIPSGCDENLGSESLTELPRSSELPLVATNGEAFPWDSIRLPDFILPVRYDIELAPNLTSGVVKGISKLVFRVSRPTSFVVFHASNLTITSRDLNERLRVTRMLELPHRDQIYLETNQKMQISKNYVIRLKYQYRLSEGMEGFYMSSYKINEKKHVLATSHFEPTYARRAFPCFDEPQMKARFVIAISHHNELNAFSNTQVVRKTSTTDQPDIVRTEFAESPIMSTYLVAFLVCDFASLSSQTKRNVSVSILASRDKIEQGKFALDSAVSMLDYYEDFFDIDYVMAKAELAAVPDFGAGAMENWGLVIYRETALLWNEEQSSVEDQQWVAIVVAHELAHQWFGNLVTMRWWNDLWLNEGFASWMEYRGVDHIKPSWQMMEQFFFDVTVPALELDALSTSHPVSVNVDDPDEIEAIFDAISYKKGAAIIQMLESTVGPSVLRSGLKHYLSLHKFANAETTDLWESIQLAWGPQAFCDIADLMETWTNRMGYPLLSIVKKKDSENTFVVTQEMFRFDAILNERREKMEDASWLVPLTFRSDLDSSDEHLTSLLLNGTQSLEIELPGGFTWLKANLGGVGFYRVQYPMDNWMALVKAINEDFTQFKPADRAQLINDAFSLARAGKVPPTLPLQFTQYLTKETSLVPLATALHHLGEWRLILFSSSSLINALINHIISPHYAKFGWENAENSSNASTKHSTQLMRKLVLNAAIESEHPQALIEAKIRFEKYLRNENNSFIRPDIRRIVYSAGVRNGDRSTWNFAWTQYLQSESIPSERSLWIRALASAIDGALLREYLELSLNKAKIRAQDVTQVIAEVARNPSNGGLIAFDHLRRHWNELTKTFGKGSFIMGAIIEATTSHLSSEFDLSTMKSFFDARKRRQVGSGLRALDQSLERVEINVDFRKKCQNEIQDFVQQWLHIKNI